MVPELISFKAPWLSQPIGTGDLFSEGMVFRRRRGQMASLMACEQAMCSASSADKATTDWDLTCQLIGLPSIKIQPPIDFQAVFLPAQSESVNPWRPILVMEVGSGGGAALIKEERWSPMVRVVPRYLKARLAAIKCICICRTL